jgi:hypothetical protein
MENKEIRLTLLVLTLIALSAVVPCWDHFPSESGSGSRGFAAAAHSQAVAGEPDYPQLPSSGKKCWIGADYYFIYQFDKRPQMGMAILKIQLFDKSGKRVTDLDILGDYGMPSMRGAHDSGDQPFKLNKKGDYLLPVNIVMAGEWEVKLTFLKGNKAIHRGSFKFTV